MCLTHSPGMIKIAFSMVLGVSTAIMLAESALFSMVMGVFTAIMEAGSAQLWCLAINQRDNKSLQKRSLVPSGHPGTYVLDAKRLLRQISCS